MKRLLIVAALLASASINALAAQCEAYEGVAIRTVTYLHDGDSLADALEQETYNAKQEGMNVSDVRAYVSAIYRNRARYMKMTPEQASDAVEAMCKIHSN